jgi:hypothetical protein
MNKDIFPKYNVENLKDNIFIEVNKSSAELHEISLERIKVITGKKFIDDNEAKINVTFSTKELTFHGEVVHFKYIRELRKYSYEINIKFNDKDTFLKWFAIIRGIHKARFNC